MERVVSNGFLREGKWTMDQYTREASEVKPGHNGVASDGGRGHGILDRGRLNPPAASTGRTFFN